MVLNTSWLFTPWVLFLAAIVLVGAGIVVLIIIEKRLNKKLVVRKKKKEEGQFQAKIDDIMKFKEPGKIVSALDETAKAFFREKLGSGVVIEYSDLVKTFKEKKDDVAARFCERMQEAIYSGDVLDRKKLDYLTKNFLFLVKREHKKEDVLEKEAPDSSWARGVFGGRKKDPTSREEVNLEKSEIAGEGKVNNKIVDYIEEGLRRGFKVSLLKQKLIEGGFEEVDVDNAIMHIESDVRDKARAKAESNFSGPRFDHKLVKLLVEGRKKNLDDESLKKNIVMEGYDLITAEKAVEYSKELIIVKTVQPKVVVQKEDPAMEKKVVEVKPAQKEEVVDGKIVVMLLEGKKKGFDMELMKKKMISRGVDAKAIDIAMRKIGGEKKSSWFGRLFGPDEKKEVVESKSDEVATMLLEGKKKGFDMELMKKKMISRGVDAKAIDIAMSKVGVGEVVDAKAIDTRMEKIKEPEFVEDKEEFMPPLAKEEVVEDAEEIVEIKKAVAGKEKLKERRIVPYIKEEIKHRKISKAQEKEIHKFVGSMDDLERVKSRIRQNRNKWGSRTEGRDESGLV